MLMPVMAFAEEKPEAAKELAICQARSQALESTLVDFARQIQREIEIVSLRFQIDQLSRKAAEAK
jgi:small-conductance mechanosensitive channel